MREATGVRGLQPLEQLPRGAIRFHLQPSSKVWPNGLEGVFASPPISSWSRLRAMRGSNLAIPPRAREVLEKLVKVGITVGKHMQRLASSESCQMVLHRPDLGEEPERV